MAQQVWEISPTHPKGKNFCGEYAFWQIRQANLSLGRLWCYLQLCWICLNGWKRSGLAYLMTTELVPAQWWYLHLKLQVLKLASQKHNKGNTTKQKPQTSKHKKWVWTESVLWLGSPNLQKCSCHCWGGSSREQCCFMHISTISFYHFKQLHEKKNCLINN